jgi:hypothetical protein
MSEKLVKTINLKNGLNLDILDSSRKIAGDRWQVVMTFRINIPVKLLALADNDHVDFDINDILASVGENVCFKHKKERNFIDGNQKDDVLDNMIDSFFYTSFDYVSNPDFPKRYILHHYREKLKRKSEKSN